MDVRRSKLEQGEECAERETSMEEFIKRSYIRGYHVYKEVWWTAVGESLVCERDPENASDAAVRKQLS